MTTERRRFPRETIDGGGRDVPGDRRQRSREPAETHFRNLSDNRPRDGQGNPPLEETALERPANADDPDRLRRDIANDAGPELTPSEPPTEWTELLDTVAKAARSSQKPTK